MIWQKSNFKILLKKNSSSFFLLYIIHFFRKRLQLNSAQALFLLFGHKSIFSVSGTMLDIYRDEKDEDGFLYIIYASQETFGWNLWTSWASQHQQFKLYFCINSSSSFLHFFIIYALKIYKQLLYILRY